MNKHTIWKQTVMAGDVYNLPWFSGARVTASVADAMGLTFWHVVQTPHPEPYRLRNVEVIGTGMPFPADWEVLATAKDPQTQLVWHLVAEPWHE